MIRLVTDAGPWIAYLRGENCPLLELALQAGTVAIPALVKLELLGNPLKEKERKSLEGLLASLPTVELTQAHIFAAARLKAKLETAGIFLGARDAHILQCAVEQKALLLTRDPLFHGLQNSTAVQMQLW